MSREKAQNYAPPARVFVHVDISREVEELDQGGQIVDCTLRSSPSAVPMLTGRIRGASTPGNYYTEDLAAPKRVARTFAEAVADRE